MNKNVNLPLLDENECLKMPCNLNQLCVNTVGSYKCDCNNGFKKKGNVCIGKRKVKNLCIFSLFDSFRFPFAQRKKNALYNTLWKFKTPNFVSYLLTFFTSIS